MKFEQTGWLMAATLTLLAACLTIPSVSLGKVVNQMHIRTTYTCDGNRMELNCQDEGLIRLVRINYGRFSLSICNEYGHSNMSTQCMSMEAHRIMYTRCEALSNCSVLVSSQTFGDPCEGTTEYLEVQYHCGDANGNSLAKNNKISPPPTQTTPLVTATAAQGQAGDSSATPAQPTGSHKSPLNTSPTIGQTTGAGGKTTNLVGGSPTSSSATSSQQLDAANSNNNNNNNQPQVATDSAQSSYNGNSNTNTDDFGPSILIPAPATATVIQQQQQQQQLQSYCSQVEQPRGLRWNFTRANQWARQNCPEGSSGRASWFCDPVTMRFAPLWSPDLSQCRSNWLQRLYSNLERILEAPARLPASQLQRSPLQAADFLHKQTDQLLKLIVGELALVSRTKELFSEDIKRIEQMIGQVIVQFRANQLALAQLPVLEYSSSAASLTSFAGLKEELFAKIVSIVSSLFEPVQRNAWLEIQPQELRQRLELRLLGHLRDSGLLLAATSGQANSPPIQRQANVLAGLVNVISQRQQDTFSGHAAPTRRDFGGQSAQYQLELVISDLPSGEYKLQLARQRPMQLYGQLMMGQQQADSFLEPTMASQLSELKLDGQLVKSLISNGVTKFLVLDVKRPDYSLIRAHLEAGAASLAASSNSNNNNNNGDSITDLNRPLTVPMIMNLANNMENDPTLSSRVFGLFPIGTAEANAPSNSPDAFAGYAKKVTHFPQRFIQVDFKISPDGMGRQTPRGDPFKVCESLNSLDNSLVASDLMGEEQQQQQQQQYNSRCSLAKFNATNYVCRCDRMGFVALTNLPQVQLETQWLNNQQQQPPPQQQVDGFVPTSPSFEITYSPDDLVRHSQASGGAEYINAPAEGAKRSSITATVITITIVVGISILVITLLSLVLNGFVRVASGRSGLNKKQSFLSTGSILTRANGNGPTTGPLVESHVGQLAAGNNTISVSAYKGHQQLYAAHLPSMDNYSSPATTATTTGSYNRWLPSSNKWSSNLLHPTRWLAALTGRGSASKSDSMIQHRVIDLGAGSLGSVVYKSQCQNGYATNLQRSPMISNSNNHNATTAPSSSTSSYLSSSAYYEEIGPGNLTKINPNHFSNTTTANGIPPRIIDHHQTSNWPPVQTATAVSYPIAPQMHYGQPISMMNAGHQAQVPLPPRSQQQQCHNQDLSHNMQSSSGQFSSAGSQTHSAATSQTTASSTPQHYLFALNQQQQQQQTLQHHH